MVTVNRLLHAVETIEQTQAMVVTSFRLSERVFRFLRFVEGYMRHYNLGSLYLESEFGALIPLDEDYETLNDGLEGKLLVSKKGPTTIFFTENYLEKMFKESNLLDPEYIVIFYPETFKSKRVRLTGREGILVQQPVFDIQQQTAPPKFTVALNAEAIRFLPVSAEQWITDHPDIVPEYWKKIAAAKLLTSIATEALWLDNKLELGFKGDRRIKLMIDLANEQLLSSIFGTTNTVASWIYSEGKDIETRHHIFNNQVCVLSITEIAHFAENFNAIADRVLENSILAYRYYIQTSNKDLSKSITEINKTLFEHISKIRQNTVDIVNGLWRDFTTAFGLMILNFSLKKPDVSSKYWNLLLIGLIVYLGISYYLSSSVGFWFYKRLKSSLTDMRNRIYGYMTDDDYNNFALLPLKSAQLKFIRTFWIVLICYIAIILLVAFALKSGSSTNITSTFKLI